MGNRVHELNAIQREFVHEQPCVVYQITADRKIEWITGSVIEVLGYDPADLVGQPDTVLYADPEKESELASVDVLIRSGGAWFSERDLLNVAGDRVPCAAAVRAVFGPSGQPRGVHVGFCTVDHVRENVNEAEGVVEVVSSMSPGRWRDRSRRSLTGFLHDLREGNGAGLALKASVKDPVDAVSFRPEAEIKFHDTL